MSISERVGRIQARFFGKTHKEITQAIQSCNDVVKRLNSQSADGRAVTELQGICQDLADYAELLRVYEADLTDIVGQKVSEKMADRNAEKRVVHRRPNTPVYKPRQDVRGNKKNG